MTTRMVRRWTQEANEALQDCLEYTDWNALSESHREDINSMTECTTASITFCVNNSTLSSQQQSLDYQLTEGE